MKKRIIIISFNQTESTNKLPKFFEAQAHWIKIFNTTWLIATDDPPSTVYTRLEPYLDKNSDRVFLSEITSSGYQGWLPRTVWDWMKEVKG